MADPTPLDSPTDEEVTSGGTIEMGETTQDVSGAVHDEQDEHDELDDTHGPDTSHHSNAHDIASIEAWKIHIFMENYPISSFCIALCSFMIFVIVVIQGVASGTLIQFSTQVPMYIRSNDARIAQDALTAGLADSNFKRPDGQQTSRQQETPAQVSLQLLFIRNDGGNILESKCLNAIKDIENSIIQTNGWDKHCLKSYNSSGVGACRRHTSVTHFFDPTYFRGALDRTYSLNPTFSNFVQFVIPSKFSQSIAPVNNMDFSAGNVKNITTYWASYGRGTVKQPFTAGVWRNMTMPGRFYWKPANSSQAPTAALGNLMLPVTSTRFGELPTSTHAEAVMSIFSFGYPLPGFKNNTDRVDSQDDAIGQWCYDNFQTPTAVFEDYSKKFGNWKMRWSCSNMASLYTQAVLMSEFLLIGATFTIVWLFMTYNMGSFWLSSWGMAMIFMNFAPTIILYRFITNFSYFGSLNIMGMFIILAIGADDIFVINDTWGQIRTISPDFPMSKRLTATIQHAGKVMLTTSLSTIMSFLANTTSSFPAVYTFGVFSAWLILVNYIAVITFYPTVLVIHDLYLYTDTLKRPWCICKCCVEKETPKCCVDPNRRYTNVKTKEEQQADLTARPADVWFENWLFPKIYNHRKKILFFFTCVFLIFFYFTTQLRPDPNLPKLLNGDNNYNEFRTDLGNYFARSDNPQQVTVNLLFGISGIDRAGTDPTVQEDIGKAVYDTKLSIDLPNEHEYIAQFCDDLICGYNNNIDCRYRSWEKLKVSRPQLGATGVVQCFMTAFRDWVLTDPDAQNPTYQGFIANQKKRGATITNNSLPFTEQQVANCTFGQWPVPDKYCFQLLLLTWIDDEVPTDSPSYAPGYTNYDLWRRDLQMQNVPGKQGPKFLFFIIRVKLDAFANTNFFSGMQLYNDWVAYMKEWSDNSVGLVTQDARSRPYVNTPDGLKSTLVSNGYFAYYFVEARIIGEAVSGISLSLLFAWIILTFATNNWFMAFVAIWTIMVIVVTVIGFTVLAGWKLGVIEAIIFVLVVGMSVDYVVHLAEAYLASGEKQSRVKAAQRMLGIVGTSVVSGAISTGSGVFVLLFARMLVFFKFGLVIFWLVFMSVTFSIIAFTAAISMIGPEGEFGNVRLCLSRCYKRCRREPLDPAPTHTSGDEQPALTLNAKNTSNKPVQLADDNESKPDWVRGSRII